MADANIRRRRTHTSYLARIGQRFGRLVVIADGGRHGGRSYLVCLCDCGNELTTWTNNLVRGSTRSCGCLREEIHRSHGRTHTPEYKIWTGIKTRCFNPNRDCYHNYGGRGITLAAEWIDDFQSFLVHIGYRPSPKHTVERMDNSRGYEPGNVRWATRSEQARNMRTTLVVAFDGRARPLADWGEELRLSPKSLRCRLRRGWTVERTLTAPVAAVRERVDTSSLIGARFGSWTVLAYVGMRGKSRRHLLCRCDCGTEREVAATGLIQGGSTTCGCSRRGPRSGKERTEPC